MTTARSLFLTGILMVCIGGAVAQQAKPDASEKRQRIMDAAEAAYDTARARCDGVAGVPHEICVAEAKAARVRVEEEAEAAYRNTLAAYTQARMRIAAAYYDRDKARCGALAGNDRDVCLQQAKAYLVAARADARADRKTVEARLDARDEKIDAEYRVALQKCDAYAGAVKDQCVGTARAAYGK